MGWKISKEIADAATSSGGGGGSYFSPSKIKSGTKARLHVLAEEPTCYFSVWAETADGKNRCFRFTQQPTAEEIEQEMGSEYRRKMRDGKPDALKAAIAFPVWNYDEAEVQLCEITQKRLIAAFDEIANTEEYDDFDSIDFTIAKEGSGLETRYTLTPLPAKKDAKEQVEEAWNVARTTISMESYVAGDNPFKKD